MLILDTDHLVALDRGSPAGVVLRQRLEASGDEVATTIICAEEQLRGWLAQIHGLNDPHREIAAYERLQRRLEFFAAWRVLSWTTGAADLFVRLRRQGIRCGTMDLKIACIAISCDAVLLSRNTADFAAIPGLQCEDWLS